MWVTRCVIYDSGGLRSRYPLIDTNAMKNTPFCALLPSLSYVSSLETMPQDIVEGMGVICKKGEEDTLVLKRFRVTICERHRHKPW
jgi:hypothetical protein